MNTFKKLAQTAIDTTVETIYTVPGSTQTLIRHIVINCPSGSSVVSLYHDGSTNVELLVNAIPLGAGERYEFDGVLSLEAGDTLMAKDTGQDDVAVITIHGLEIS